MKKFYEAFEGTFGSERWLVLTESDQTTDLLRRCRPPSWALCTMRPGSTLNRTLSEDEEDVHTLQIVCGNPQDKGWRYERIVILQRGEADQVAPLVEAFRDRIPELVGEGRLLLAAVRVDASEDEIINTILTGTTVVSS